MRTLILVLILACGFGSAALWQQMRVQRLREERVLAAEIRAGSLARTPSGILGKDEAVVVIGRPAGDSSADSAGTTAPPVPDKGGAAIPPAGAPPVAPPPPGDFVMEVSAGQSLSTIAKAHYGHAPVELVTKLAQYNGLTDANALRAGMTLKLPPLDKLGVVIK